MNELIHTTESDKENVNARPLSQAELDSLYLEVQDLLDVDTPDVDVRAKISSFLESFGQPALGEEETQRDMTLDIEGEIVERTIVVSPEDFGTNVRPISELISDGFVEVDVSNENDLPVAKVEHDLGDVALTEVSREEFIEARLGELDAMMITAESDEEEAEPKGESAIDELLADNTWKRLESTSNQLKQRTNTIVQHLDDFDTLLAAMNRDGGRIENGAMRLNQAMDSLRSMVFSGGLSADLAHRTRKLFGSAEEAYDNARSTEVPDDEEATKGRKLLEATDELMSETRVIDGHYEELRKKLGQHGRFQSNLEELIRSTHGYEYTIAQLRSEISAMSDDLHNTHGRLSRVEATIQDVDRLRRI